MPGYLSVREIETLAARVFRAYCALRPVREAGPVFRVEPELLLRDLLGLTVEYRRISEDGSVLGVTAYDEVGVELCGGEELFFFAGKTVLIEAELLSESRTGRRNFTVMHEGCHHILRAPGRGGDAGRPLMYRGVQAGGSREEWQADRLAAAVLMPEELVGRAMFLTGQEGRIDVLHPVWRWREYERFCSMCGILGVSKQALSIRMQTLGLLGRAYLRDPDEILFIETETDCDG